MMKTRLACRLDFLHDVHPAKRSMSIWMNAALLMSLFNDMHGRALQDPHRVEGALLGTSGALYYSLDAGRIQAQEQVVCNRYACYVLRQCQKNPQDFILFECFCNPTFHNLVPTLPE